MKTNICGKAVPNKYNPSARAPKVTSLSPSSVHGYAGTNNLSTLKKNEVVFHLIAQNRYERFAGFAREIYNYAVDKTPFKTAFVEKQNVYLTQDKRGFTVVNIRCNQANCWKRLKTAFSELSKYKHLVCPRIGTGLFGYSEEIMLKNLLDLVSQTQSQVRILPYDNHPERVLLPKQLSLNFKVEPLKEKPNLLHVTASKHSNGAKDMLSKINRPFSCVAKSHDSSLVSFSYKTTAERQLISRATTTNPFRDLTLTPRDFYDNDLDYAHVQEQKLSHQLRTLTNLLPQTGSVDLKRIIKARLCDYLVPTKFAAVLKIAEDHFFPTFTGRKVVAQNDSILSHQENMEPQINVEPVLVNDNTVIVTPIISTPATSPIDSTPVANVLKMETQTNVEQVLETVDIVIETPIVEEVVAAEFTLVKKKTKKVKNVISFPPPSESSDEDEEKSPRITPKTAVKSRPTRNDTFSLRKNFNKFLYSQQQRMTGLKKPFSVPATERICLAEAWVNDNRDEFAHMSLSIKPNIQKFGQGFYGEENLANPSCVDKVGSYKPNFFWALKYGSTYILAPKIERLSPAEKHLIPKLADRYPLDHVVFIPNECTDSFDPQLRAVSVLQHVEAQSDIVKPSTSDGPTIQEARDEENLFQIDELHDTLVMLGKAYTRCWHADDLQDINDESEKVCKKLDRIRCLSDRTKAAKKLLLRMIQNFQAKIDNTQLRPFILVEGQVWVPEERPLIPLPFPEIDMSEIYESEHIEDQVQETVAEILTEETDLVFLTPNMTEVADEAIPIIRLVETPPIEIVPTIAVVEQTPEPEIVIETIPEPEAVIETVPVSEVVEVIIPDDTSILPDPLVPVDVSTSLSHIVCISSACSTVKYWVDSIFGWIADLTDAVLAPFNYVTNMGVAYVTYATIIAYTSVEDTLVAISDAPASLYASVSNTVSNWYDYFVTPTPVADQREILIENQQPPTVLAEKIIYSMVSAGTRFWATKIRDEEQVYFGHSKSEDPMAINNLQCGTFDQLRDDDEDVTEIFARALHYHCVTLRTNIPDDLNIKIYVYGKDIILSTSDLL